MLRRWRGAWPRRSGWFDPPWPPPPAAPAPPPGFLRRTLRLVLPARRGVFTEPPWAASTWPPIFRDQSARRGAVSRRGKFQPVAAPIGTLTETFEGFSDGETWADATTHGQWFVQFGGNTGPGVGIEVDNTKVLYLRPQASTDPTPGVETHASLVTSQTVFGNAIDFTGRVKTVAQLRQNLNPNPWEVAWVVWHYTDNNHFYYFTAKPNGWELGKRNPLYPGNQRFLATGSAPTFTVGQWLKFRVVHGPAGQIQVYVDDQLLTSFNDTSPGPNGDAPYTEGRVGLYGEDAWIRWDDLTVNAAALAVANPWTPADRNLDQNARRVALVRRGRFQPLPPAVVAAPAVRAPTFGSQRPRRGILARRGGFQPVPIPVPYAPTFEGQRPRRGVLGRRGRFQAVPPAAVAPAAPSAVPALLRARSRWLPKPRRGVVYGPTWSPVTYGTGLALGVGAAGRPGRQAGPARRGQQFEPPWTVAAVQPSVWLPPFVQAGPRRAGRPTRRGQFFEPPWVEGPQTVWRPGQIRQTPRLAGRPARRGQYAEPPWPQGAQQPNVWLPGLIRAGGRLAGRPFRRGQYFEPPWPQGAQAPTWTPDFRGRRRPFSGGAGSRNRYQWTPPRPAGVPAWLRSRPRPVPSLGRRGQFCEPPWPQGPQSIWRPDPICPVGTRPKWPTHRLRRGRYAEPPWPQVPPPPFSIGALTARDAASGVLTAVGAAAALGATDAAGGRLTAADDEAGALTATDQRGGPS